MKLLMESWRKWKLTEGKLQYSVSNTGYGDVYEFFDENGEETEQTLGMMVLDLADAGVGGWAPEEQIDRMMAVNADPSKNQGGMQKWDSSVFEDYYGADNQKILQAWAKMSGMELEQMPEAEDEYEDDGTNDFEEYYSESKKRNKVHEGRMKQEEAKMKLKSFKTLNENWNKWVNESPEDDERGQLIDAIREYSKDLTGSRDDYGSFEKLEAMSLEQLQDYLKGMANSPEAQEREDRFRDEEEAAMGADSDFDRMPKQQGMGRPMEEGEGAMDSSEIISYLDGMIDDLNLEVVSFQNFDADVNNRGRSSIEEVSFERGAAEAKKEAIEKLDAILNMIKAGNEKGVQNEAVGLEERIKKTVARKLLERKQK